MYIIIYFIMYIKTLCEQCQHGWRRPQSSSTLQLYSQPAWTFIIQDVFYDWFRSKTSEKPEKPASTWRHLCIGAVLPFQRLWWEFLEFVQGHLMSSGNLWLQQGHLSSALDESDDPLLLATSVHSNLLEIVNVAWFSAFFFMYIRGYKCVRAIMAKFKITPAES